MLLTPSMIGAVLAGICLWSLFWAALHKIEEIPGVKDLLTTNQCLEWIEQRPGLTLLLTEERVREFRFLLLNSVEAQRVVCEFACHDQTIPHLPS